MRIGWQVFVSISILAGWDSLPLLGFLFWRKLYIPITFTGIISKHSHMVLQVGTK
jgi:hypothetical protein